MLRCTLSTISFCRPVFKAFQNKVVGREGQDFFFYVNFRFGMKTKVCVNHLYKYSSEWGGVLYAWFLSMHTRVDLMFCGRQGEAALLQAAVAVCDVLARLEKMANYYDPASELACLNRTAACAPQPVSDELCDMLAFCLSCYDRTEGWFDVTVSSDAYVPGVTIHQVRLMQHERVLSFNREGVSINLSGFLKGYALESVRQVLRQHRIVDALVNMGNSSVLALGHAPQAEGWRIGFGQSGYGGPEVLLCDECLTTSGNDSLQRRHIMNPHTGQLVEGKRQVAVITSDGGSGEVLSTALFVADSSQRAVMEKEFSPRIIIDL